jgi:hypothetical protein
MTTLKSTLLYIGVFAIACGTLAAQDAQRSPQMSVNKASPIVHRGDAPPAGLTKIFSNLGSATDLYDSANGYLVEGPANPVTAQFQWIADPFTPNANFTVKQIGIALAYEGAGTNTAEVALYADHNGLPGKILGNWNVANLPTAGTCCTMVRAKSKRGVKIEKGKQYWVVGRTDKASTTTYAAWNHVWNDAVGPIAFIATATNNVWTAYGAGPTQAFAVYGTKP